MVIIGITGTIGAGKGTIVDFLEKEKGFDHYSVREYLIEEIKKRGIEVNRDSMTSVANDLRAKHSPSYIIDQLYARARANGKNCVIESIRTPGEIDSLRKKENFCLFAVDADPAIRFRRIKARASETDKVDFETFSANEKREMDTDDPNKQNLQKCISMADYVFDNNGSINELISKTSQTIDKIMYESK
jgi:dephospho-CoA kinase